MSSYKFDEGDDIVFYKYPARGEMIWEAPPTPKEGDVFEFTDSRGKVWRGTFGEPQPRTDDGTRFTIPLRYEERP